MTPEEIRSRVAKSAVKLTAGGFRPTGEPTESWLGRVFLSGPDEERPVNSVGDPLLPLAQICLASSPFAPACLEGVELVTVFIGSSLPDEFEPMDENWIIREYSNMADLIERDWPSPRSFLKPFPVSFQRIDDEWPCWDGGGLTDEMSDAILALEASGEISDYYDLGEHYYVHKVGGYPSFCQPGIDPGDGFEFAFQISSDPKINLNVVDGGSLQFYRNPATAEWKLYYDFY